MIAMDLTRKADENDAGSGDFDNDEDFDDDDFEDDDPYEQRDVVAPLSESASPPPQKVACSVSAIG